MATLATVAPAESWGAYVALFLAVAASWAGVPFIGTAAITAAAIAASQGTLDLSVVVVVATVAGEVGGLIGYAVGDRWGREILERPGKHQARRQKAVERGEAAYARWGRVAVFITPAIVSGTAKMARGQFIVWNLIASFAFTVSVAASTYGVGRLLSGNTSLRDVLTLVAGLAATALVIWVYVRRRRRAGPRHHAPSDPDPS
jgi:membrane protein DedA with SNARE-associated domain